MMKMLALNLVSVIVRLLWDMASLGDVVSGVLLRPQMTFHTSGMSSFDKELCRRSFQLLALALLTAMFASRQASIHFCWFCWVVQHRWFQLQIFAWMWGLIQGFSFLLGLVLPSWSEAEDMRIVVESWDMDWTWLMIVVDDDGNW